MVKPFHELRERLLRAGIAPRHVRRYLAELDDHYADLRAEAELDGLSRAEAESSALDRLGTSDNLTRAMIENRRFQAWCVRAPWAIFGLAPFGCLAAAYCVACFILWSGWQIFLPGADTPFGGHTGSPIYGFENIYFQTGRLLYFSAPILIGWGLGLMAALQRVRAIWPSIAFVLITCMGGTAQIHASRTAVTRGLGNISMTFFGLGPSAQSISSNTSHVLVTLTVVALPYVVWRMRGMYAHSD